MSGEETDPLASHPGASAAPDPLASDAPDPLASDVPDPPASHPGPSSAPDPDAPAAESAGLAGLLADPEIAPAEESAALADLLATPQEAAPVEMSEDDAFDENASFADLLEAHSGTAETVRTGERVKATVVAIGEDTVFVATGAKVDGLVERKELEDAEGNLSLAVGDVLELYVVSANASEIKLSRAMSGQAGLAQLEDALSGGIPVEGRVTGPCKGGFSVEVMKRRAFCPASQMDLRPGAEPDSFTGQTFQFLITRLEQNGRNIVVSRRKIGRAHV